MTDWTTYAGVIPPYDILTDADVQKMTDAIFELMREIGVKFEPHQKAFDLFAGAGCDISDERIVKFPTDLVESSIESVAKSYKLWNRSGTEIFEHGGERSIFMPGMTCIFFVDPKTGERRSSTKEDLATIIRVADALPEMDGVCLPCKMTERPDVLGEIEEFAVMATNTTKPLTYLSEYPMAFEAAIEMAAAIRGGTDQLREKPYFSHSVTPLPLQYFKDHTDQMLLAAENGIPVHSGTASIGGASTPITIAGNVIHCCATELAGVVLTQLAEKGSYCSVGSTIVFMDRVTGNLGGGPETLMAELAQAQITRSMGFPGVGGNGGLNLGKQFNQDAVSMIGMSMMASVFARATGCAYVGSIDSDMTFSLHALLYCNELAGMSRRIWKGIRVDDETLALDVTRSVGPGGDYLSEMHTAAHCRTEFWGTKYGQATDFETWEREGAKDLRDRIDEELRTILETHQPEPLPDSIQSQIDAILKKFGVN
jgi:trimethylamine:corrinoid methyltransferase-like protein